jgi:LemA protein
MLLVLIAVALAGALAAGHLTRRRHRMAGDAARVAGAWQQVDRHLHRRAALVPALLTAVHAHATHERYVFAHVQHTLDAALQVRRGSRRNREQAENALGHAVDTLLRVAATHPALQQDPSFVRTAEQYAVANRRLSEAFDRYNETVAVLNADVAAAPTVAGWCGVRPAVAVEFTAPIRPAVALRAA